MSFPRSRIINDRDIEEYLSALEGGYLSEDGMEMSDTEDNEESIFYTNRNEPLQDVEDDDNLENEPTLHEEQVDVHDPPLIQETVASKAGENSACSTWVLDKRKLIWKKSTLQFSESNVEFEGSTDLGTEITALKTPYQCFNYFFTTELCNKIISETNLYATQLNPENRFNLSHYDLKKFLGILLYMSVQHFPSTRKYWSRRFGFEPIKQTMNVNTFEKIKKYIHFNDNDKYIPVNQPGHDRLYKVRPIIDSLNQTFSSVKKHQRLSIDEQMCATKVGHYLKQYLPNKPHKWGFKLYVLCSVFGFAYKFEIYSGQDISTRPEGEPDLGSTNNIVLRLTRDVPRMVNHIIFFDNFYTSVPLVIYLAKQGIHCLGTIQQNRIPNNKLPDKKEMMKKNTPRGTYEERTASYEGVDLACIAWKDNKIVTMLSSYVGTEPVSTVKRFDKKTRERVDILCPKSITEYNSHMGGVDLLDSFMGRYHIRVKSRKWYIRIFFHLFDLAVINSWIIYKNNAIKEKVAKKNILNLGEFRNDLAYVLCNSGTNENKRGRPSSSSLEQELQAKKKRLQSKPIPPLDIRMDGLGHWPDVGVSLRCKYPHCTGYTTISCAKCGINLCLNKNNNCFTRFHTT
ncbi:unnamed protein product [Parnassius mnemosyne]|uniref:PiggyBac transposable element-derived protein domain-containing protein n=1 Tax=Parnassius mnemosyne TaxID=213953 RepID=A0AAV1KC28_9NEOP